MNITIDASGKYEVRFNGTLYDSCGTDLDCPGELVCLRNESWVSASEMCVCPLTLGRTGVDCTQTNLSGWVLICISSLALCLALLSFFVGVYNVLSIALDSKIRERIPAHSALFTTLVLTIIASLCISLQTIYQVASHFVPRTALVVVNGENSKQSILIFFNLVTTTLSFFFAITAALNISLVLLEIADRVSKGSSKVHVNVYVYRKFLVGYGVTFGALIVIFAAVGRPEWTFLAAAPAVLFIATTYLLGWIRLARLFGKNELPNLVGGSSSKLQAALRNIKVTTLGISFCAVGMIISGILQVALDALNRPDQSFAAIPGRTVWVFAALTMLFLIHYAHVHVRGKIPSSTKRSSQIEKEIVDLGEPHKQLAHATQNDM